MKFEHGAAYVMGVVLPLGEVLRRKTDFSDIHAYLDDFIVGVLLLYAARAVSSGKKSGDVLLCIAWATLCCGLYGSFFWQVVSDEALDVGGFSNQAMILIKGVLYAIALTSLVLSARTAIGRQNL